MTRLEAYKQHYQAVINNVLRAFPRNSKKLIAFWNKFKPEEPIAPGGQLTGDQVDSLVNGLRAKLQTVVDSDLNIGARCPFGCFFVHEPDENGVIEVIRLAGGIDIIKKVDQSGSMLAYFRDRATGEEALYRTYS